MAWGWTSEHASFLNEASFMREGSSAKLKWESKGCPGKTQPLEMWSCPDSEKIIVSRFDEGFIVLTF